MVHSQSQPVMARESSCRSALSCINIHTYVYSGCIWVYKAMVCLRGAYGCIKPWFAWPCVLWGPLHERRFSLTSAQAVLLGQWGTVDGGVGDAFMRVPPPPRARPRRLLLHRLHTPPGLGSVPVVVVVSAWEHTIPYLQVLCEIKRGLCFTGYGCEGGTTVWET